MLINQMFKSMEGAMDSNRKVKIRAIIVRNSMGLITNESSSVSTNTIILSLNYQWQMLLSLILAKEIWVKQTW